jgi:hypothetical protein
METVSRIDAGLPPPADWTALLGLRELFCAHLKARRAVRLYPPAHALREVALVEFVDCSRKVLARRDVEIEIRDDQVLWQGSTVFVEPASDRFFPALFDAGIRSLRITSDSTDSSLREFARRGAEPPCDDDPVEVLDRWAEALARADLPGIECGVCARS